MKIFLTQSTSRSRPVRVTLTIVRYLDIILHTGGSIQTRIGRAERSWNTKLCHISFVSWQKPIYILTFPFMIQRMTSVEREIYLWNPWTGEKIDLLTQTIHSSIFVFPIWAICVAVTYIVSHYCWEISHANSQHWQFNDKKKTMQ